MTIIDAPFKITEHGLKHYVNQIRTKVLGRLHDVYGADVSDASIRKAGGSHLAGFRRYAGVVKHFREKVPQGNLRHFPCRRGL